MLNIFTLNLYSVIKKISLKSDIPVDFEFQLNLLQSHPAVKIEPKKGRIFYLYCSFVYLIYASTMLYPKPAFSVM